MKTVITFLLIFLVGCGATDATINKNTKDKKETIKTTTTTELTGEYLIVNGYVSPIDISVNGQQYQDSEDFYTQEVKRLAADTNVKYPDYNLYFDADVGLKDFKYGLSVFLVASDTTGVASESSVDSKGKFTFNLPPETDKNGQYILRASKRIGLRLVKDNQPTIIWCYNLFAESQVTLADKSFILRSFETKITSYKCEEKEAAIDLPDNPYKYVTEAFENAKEYNGYGPLPKTESKPVNTTTPTETTTTGSTTLPAPTPTPTPTPTPVPTPTSTGSTVVPVLTPAN